MSGGAERAVSDGGPYPIYVAALSVGRAAALRAFLIPEFKIGPGIGWTPRRDTVSRLVAINETKGYSQGLDADARRSTSPEAEPAKVVTQCDDIELSKYLLLQVVPEEAEYLGLVSPLIEAGDLPLGNGGGRGLAQFGKALKPELHNIGRDGIHNQRQLTSSNLIAIQRVTFVSAVEPERVQVPAQDAACDVLRKWQFVALLWVGRHQRFPFGFGQPHVVWLSFMCCGASILIVRFLCFMALLVEPEILAGGVAKLPRVVAHQGPHMNLEDQTARRGNNLLRWGINLALVGDLDCAGGAFNVRESLPFFQRLLQINSRATRLVKNPAARSHTTQSGFKLVQIQARIAVELTDSILAQLVGAVDGQGNKVFNDQLDILFRPPGGRTARVETAASAHSDAETFARHHEKQGFSFVCGFLACVLQVGQPRNRHPA